MRIHKKRLNLQTGHRETINEFLRPWNRRRDVIGALLVGSYATGLATLQSDIDICIILRDTIRRWRRGNIVMSGFLIEYAAYPIPHLKYLQDRDLTEGMRLRTRMLATGIILFDRTGTIQKLQRKARWLLRKKLPKQSKEIIEMHKYLLWNQLDNLLDLKKEHSQGKGGFAYAYYAGLQNILHFYASFLRLEIPRPNRIHRFLYDSEFRKKYSIAGLPDVSFSKLFESAMREPSLPIFKQLTAYVHKRMGGFSINGWKLRGHTPRSLKRLDTRR